MEISQTKRVYLEPGGFLKKRAWADFFLELRHGTQRAVNELVRPFAVVPEGNAKIQVGEDLQPKYIGGKTVEIEVNKVDWTAVDDIILLGQIKEWSFGPVDQATLDSLPDEVVKTLVNEANLIYGKQGPLPKGGGGN
jgi:hypothetical protein